MNEPSSLKDFKMSTDSYITIVSGLPRSGTSLMMQMLHSGGMTIVTDHLRTADIDNPRGYYEFEKVKTIREDVSWLPDTRGKAFKMISQLLYHLPATENYRIIFMERDLDEMLSSQDIMLRRRGVEPGPYDDIKHSYEIHLDRLKEWIQRQANIQVLYVSYNLLLMQPENESKRINSFLQGLLNQKCMEESVDTALYRNKRNTIPLPTGE